MTLQGVETVIWLAILIGQIVVTLAALGHGYAGASAICLAGLLVIIAMGFTGGFIPTIIGGL